MKKFLYIILLCACTMSVQAQKITRHYQNESLSKVLEDLNKVAGEKAIYFIYDELEDFTVTSHFDHLMLEDAIKEVIGFYPIKVTSDKDRIFVECIQKADAKVIGRVVDEGGNPVEFANISLLNNGTFINGGVSNENGDFVIPCSLKNVVAQVSYVGYKTVSREVHVGNIGTITLMPETYTVSGVVVKGEIPQYDGSRRYDGGCRALYPARYWHCQRSVVDDANGAAG